MKLPVRVLWLLAVLALLFGATVVVAAPTKGSAVPAGEKVSAFVLAGHGTDLVAVVVQGSASKTEPQIEVAVADLFAMKYDAKYLSHMGTKAQRLTVPTFIPGTLLCRAIIGLPIGIHSAAPAASDTREPATIIVVHLDKPLTHGTTWVAIDKTSFYADIGSFAGKTTEMAAIFSADKTKLTPAAYQFDAKKIITARCGPPATQLQLCQTHKANKAFEITKSAGDFLALFDGKTLVKLAAFGPQAATRTLSA